MDVDDVGIRFLDPEEAETPYAKALRDGATLRGAIDLRGEPSSSAVRN